MFSSPPEDLAGCLHWAAEFLPSQGPLHAFIHHNTLHAFQHLPFDEAVAEGSRVYGCQPYMDEEWYRRELAKGRITAADLEWSLERCRSNPEDKPLRRALLHYQLIQPHPDRLAWHLNETGALWRFRPQLETGLKEQLLKETVAWLAEQKEVSSWLEPFPDEQRGRNLEDCLRREPEVLAPRALWTACLRAVRGHCRTPAPPPHSDRVWPGDTRVHPVLIRWCSAFLDQGVAGRAMPGREAGFYLAVRRLYASRAWLGPVWMDPLPGLLQQEAAAGWDSLQSVGNSLLQLGVGRERQAPFLRDRGLALKGWAGMMYQSEVRPDRLPFAAVPARFVDFMAVRLLLDRLARAPRPAEPPYPDRLEGPALAFELYQVCQFMGWGPGRVMGMGTGEVGAVLKQVEDFPSLLRRQVLHHAYEHNYEVQTLDALVAHPRHRPQQPRPLFQALFCIDEREESTRRHLEELEPRCETFGTAGFFGIPMYFKALHEPQPVALCPVVITPRHTVEEVAEIGDQERQLRSLRRMLGQVSLQLHTGSHSLTLGGLLASTLGLLTSLPDILRVLFPRGVGYAARGFKKRLRPQKTRLSIGFSLEEQAEIVSNVLGETGMIGNLSSLVIVFGHGSSSLNNPHEAAHDCGACGGGRGGPNARVFAAMANHPEVRAALAGRGFNIPDDTVFVGAYHNTCDDEMEFFVEETTPELEYALRCLQKARERDAQERCRRFDSAAPYINARSALFHVQARAEDLAQPRPEYGHATNAVCFVGRRERTRGLYMDRRAFLVSYDPGLDDKQGTRLGKVLGAVVPVGAGINLEYYFSFVDNQGYGCGTKLPHNITGLLGVMDGFSSDLRTGLPWQMVEIHEPVRLLSVVECKLEVINRVLERLPQLVPWVANGWMKLGLLDPDSQDLVLFERGQWVPYQPAAPELPRVPDSRCWFEARSEHLGYAEVG